LWTKGLSAKDIHKEVFPAYGGKCLSYKALHSWVEKRGKIFTDDADDEKEVRKWLRQQPKDSYAVDVFWDVAVSAHAGSSLPNFYTLKKEAIRSSETSVHTRFTRCHIPEDGILHMFYILYPICQLFADSPSHVVFFLEVAKCRS
jgi:hypothetical protein